MSSGRLEPPALRLSGVHSTSELQALWNRWIRTNASSYQNECLTTWLHSIKKEGPEEPHIYFVESVHSKNLRSAIPKDGTITRIYKK